LRVSDNSSSNIAEIRSPGVDDEKNSVPELILRGFRPPLSSAYVEYDASGLSVETLMRSHTDAGMASKYNSIATNIDLAGTSSEVSDNDLPTYGMPYRLRQLVLASWSAHPSHRPSLDGKFVFSLFIITYYYSFMCVHWCRLQPLSMHWKNYGKKSAMNTCLDAILNCKEFLLQIRFLLILIVTGF
jgi:hypothetical protein